MTREYVKKIHYGRSGETEVSFLKGNHHVKYYSD